jgi:hypothetical protein
MDGSIGHATTCAKCEGAHPTERCTVLRPTRIVPHHSPTTSAHVPLINFRFRYHPAATRDELLKQIVTSLHEDTVRQYRLDTWQRQQTINLIVRRMHARIRRESLSRLRRGLQP